MKWWTIKFPAALAAFLVPANAALASDSVSVVHDTIYMETPAWEPTARDARYQHHVTNAKKLWTSIVPNQFTVQYAGSTGAFNLGLGWHYGKHLHWESELLLGYLPKGVSPHNHCTLTLRETYIPWRIGLSRHRRWVFTPFTTALGINYLWGKEFWRDDSGRVTSCYGLFNTRVRFHLAFGEELTFNIPRRHRHFVRSIRAYYQFVATDVYIVSAATNRHELSFTDWFKMGIGLKLDLF